MIDSYEVLHERELRHLEEMAGRLLQLRLTTGQELWAFEIELARYQIELQDKVGKAQKSRRALQQEIATLAKQKSEGWKATVIGLQGELTYQNNAAEIFTHAHRLTRQLGDALAWLMLGQDEGNLLALTQNERVPSTTRGLSLQGLLTIAEMFANEGAGFPLIHDITHCLRVGDVTFVRPKEEPLTIEVKTRVVSREGNTARLHVETYAPNDAPRWEMILGKLRQQPLDVTESIKDPSEAMRPLRSPSRQLGRQLKRMKKSRIMQTAEPGVVLPGLEHNQIVIRSSVGAHASHWEIVQTLAQEARKDGFASRVVDDSMVYVATYTATPHVYPYENETPSVLPYSETLQNTLSSILPRAAMADQNYVWVGTSYAYLLGDVPAFIRPLLLYPLPFELIADLLWGRLAFMVFVNLAKLAEAVERVGLHARVPATDDEFRRKFLHIWSSIDIPNGTRMVGDLAGLPHQFGAKMAYEFLSVDGFVTLAVEGMQALMNAARSKQESSESNEESLNGRDRRS